MPTTTSTQALGMYGEHSSTMNASGDKTLNERSIEPEGSRRAEENEIEGGHEEQLPRGWTRMWSKTKNRPYYKYAAPRECTLLTRRHFTCSLCCT